MWLAREEDGNDESISGSNMHVGVLGGLDISCNIDQVEDEDSLVHMMFSTQEVSRKWMHGRIFRRFAVALS